jgi:hypothetical protein
MQNGIVAEDCGCCPFWERGKVIQFERVQIVTATPSTTLVGRAMSLNASSMNPEPEAAFPPLPLPPTPPLYAPSSPPLPPSPPPAQPVADGDGSTLVVTPDMRKDPLVDIPAGNHPELEAPLRDYLLDMPNPDRDGWDVDVGLCWLDTGTVSMVVLFILLSTLTISIEHHDSEASRGRSRSCQDFPRPDRGPTRIRG